MTFFSRVIFDISYLSLYTPFALEPMLWSQYLRIVMVSSRVSLTSLAPALGQVRGRTRPECRSASPSDRVGAGFCVEMPMDIRELTTEMNRFVEAMGWYRADSPCAQTPRNIAISLSLEASEVLEHFQWGEGADSEGLAEELADVALYLLQLAYLTGVDLEQAILDKLKVNYERDWSKG